MNNAAKALFLAALVGAPCSAQTVCPTPLWVGAWNIQWLGNAEKGKRKPQTPENIASYIDASKVDVLAMAEISATSTAGGKGRNKQLDDAFALLNAKGAQWTYELFPKREGARDPQDQWTGLAWNEKKIQKAADSWKLDLTIDSQKEKSIAAKFNKPEDGTIILSRSPYATKLSAGAGKSDFLFVPVHLKSNIGGKATAAARAYEAELIVAALAAQKESAKDKDVVILGDTNMLVANEAASAAFTSAGFKDCNRDDLGTHLNMNPNQSDAPFDRIFIPANEPETKMSCNAAKDFALFKPVDWKPGLTASQFREQLSDHILVRTSLCIGKDDD